MNDIKTIEGDFTGGKGKYAIVVGRWNSFVVEHLLEGAVDCLDVYTTDGRLLVHDLTVLEHDRGLFPPYEAAALGVYLHARAGEELRVSVGDAGLMATDLLPDITYPSVTVQTTYDGAAPVEVENLITRPVENAVGVVNNVVRVVSSSRADTSEVTLELAWDTDMDLAALDVRERQRTRRPLVVLGLGVRAWLRSGRRVSIAGLEVLRLAVLGLVLAEGVVEEGQVGVGGAVVHVLVLEEDQVVAAQQQAAVRGCLQAEPVAGLAALRDHDAVVDALEVDLHPLAAHSHTRPQDRTVVELLRHHATAVPAL